METNEKEFKGKWKGQLGRERGEKNKISALSSPQK